MARGRMMRQLRALLLRFRGLLRNRERDQEFTDELRKPCANAHRRQSAARDECAGRTQGGTDETWGSNADGRELSRTARRSTRRDIAARFAVRSANAAQESRIRHRRYCYPRPRHRRLNFHLLACRHRAVTPSPLSESRANRSRLGAGSRWSPNELSGPEFRRFSDTEQHVRDYGCIWLWAVIHFRRQ